MDDTDDVIDESMELDVESELDEDLYTDEREAPAGSVSLNADAILDTLMPRSIDWRDTVRRHPLGSVAVIGLVGYLVGRTKGSNIMAGVTAGLSSAMMRQLSDVFEGDFFDF
jgi:hypothetical protein